jgi:hypothetical protein
MKSRARAIHVLLLLLLLLLLLYVMVGLKFGRVGDRHGMTPVSWQTLIGRVPGRRRERMLLV